MLAPTHLGQLKDVKQLRGILEYYFHDNDVTFQNNVGASRMLAFLTRVDRLVRFRTAAARAKRRYAKSDSTTFALKTLLLGGF